MQTLWQWHQHYRRCQTEEERSTTTSKEGQHSNTFFALADSRKHKTPVSSNRYPNCAYQLSLVSVHIKRGVSYVAWLLIQEINYVEKCSSCNFSFLSQSKDTVLNVVCWYWVKDIRWLRVVAKWERRYPTIMRE